MAIKKVEKTKDKILPIHNGIQYQQHTVIGLAYSLINS